MERARQMWTDIRLSFNTDKIKIVLFHKNRSWLVTQENKRNLFRLNRRLHECCWSDIVFADFPTRRFRYIFWIFTNLSAMSSVHITWSLHAGLEYAAILTGCSLASVLPDTDDVTMSDIIRQVRIITSARVPPFCEYTRKWVAGDSRAGDRAQQQFYKTWGRESLQHPDLSIYFKCVNLPFFFPFMYVLACQLAHTFLR